MSVVYVKDLHATSREEMKMDDLPSTPVRVLRSLVAQKIGVEDDALMLMYAGRVLKLGKTLSDYNIIEGVTVFYLKKKESKPVVSVQSSVNHSLSKIKLMLRNPRVFRVLRRLITSPSLLESMLKGSRLFASPGVQMLLNDAGIRESTTDPESLIRAFECRPEGAVAVASILQLLGTAVEDVSESTGYDRDEVEGELVEMIDRSVVEGVDYFGEARENMQRRELADAQEQMFHHSQALQAHQQNQSTSQESEPMETTTTTHQSPPPSSEHVQSLDPPSYDSLMNTSIQGDGSSSSSSGITPGMLASALSTVQHSQIPPHSSNFLSPPQSSHSGPSSLPSQLQSSSEQEDRLSSRSSSNPSLGITQEDLMIALQSVNRRVPGNQTSPSEQQQEQKEQSSSSSRHRRHHGHRSERRHKYRKQLEQLKGMGIEDEAAILHTLEATKGDINAALELLIGGHHS